MKLLLLTSSILLLSSCTTEYHYVFIADYCQKNIRGFDGYVSGYIGTIDPVMSGKILILGDDSTIENVCNFSFTRNPIE